MGEITHKVAIYVFEAPEGGYYFDIENATNGMPITQYRNEPYDTPIDAMKAAGEHLEEQPNYAVRRGKF